MGDLNDVQRRALAALCDTVVPSLSREDDVDGFFARRASDLDIAEMVERSLANLPEERRIGVARVLDQLAGQGIADSSLPPDAAAGVAALTSLALFLYYGSADGHGENPNWRTFGYAVPPTPSPPPGERSLRPLVPARDTVLEADVCIVGSGAGGGVMAGVLSARGLHVVVLEVGGYFDDADFAQREVAAYRDMYWRGGPSPTVDQNVTLMAGRCLGGGTTVNWMNSMRTTPWVREQWEREFGLEGLAGAEFDRHLDAVWSRLGVNDRCSQLNRPHERMRRGAEALGWSFTLAHRNCDEQRYAFETAGFVGFGDRTGAKQSTVKTYLQDASDRGAVLVTDCSAQRILTDRGRATGVEATWSDRSSGRRASVTVRAPRVVVACGALESPALLLRSGIGGPVTGDYLRLHPCTATVALYGEDMQSWLGAPQAGVITEFERHRDGFGFLIEGAHYAPGTAASSLPFADATTHREMMSSLRHAVTFISLLRDHGHGRVTVDRAGAAMPSYSLADEVDLSNARLGIAAQARLHEAGGALHIHPSVANGPAWHAGDDLDAFIERTQRIPMRAAARRLFSAHQMGTCRMGTDPRTSVANPWGELHDTAGVWIGDASAFPTATGTNPMITIMALAHRNAQAIAASVPSARAAA